ncbi:hypothetical protein [Vreelandella maris]|uniref:Uncharacterized protein n=1 Tax=Vreelandella maris TaxID=2729617 RepID=A0A7Y6RA16_9GAMM|nr:hypothetical protein [Halomonas maris]NVF12983.1 hypothetical protein [Halomonas maris]
MEESLEMSWHRDCLLSASYRMAGHLVMMECCGTGGWMLVWKNPNPEVGGVAYPSMVSSCSTTAELHAVIAMGGIAAELLQQGRQIDAAQLAKEAQERHGFFEEPRIIEAAPHAAAFALYTVRAQWEAIEAYAKRVIDQWADPLALEQFRIDRIYPDGKRANGGDAPIHFLPACAPGQLTPAALVQSADPAYHIPSEYRA